MKREPPVVPHGAIRVDVHMVRYGEGFPDDDHEVRIQRLADLIRTAVTNVIYAHAKEELRPDTMMPLCVPSVHTRIHDGLGPAWSPEEGSDPWIPGAWSAKSHEDDFSLECAQFYQTGQRHVTVVVDWL
jgi:hypothetical protein